MWPRCLPVHLVTELFNCLLGLVTNTWYGWPFGPGEPGDLHHQPVCHVASLLPLLISIGHQRPLHQKLTLHSARRYISCLVEIGRPMFQCCICVERYIAVGYPLVYLKYIPLRYRQGCITVQCLVTLCLSCVSGCYHRWHQIPCCYLCRGSVHRRVLQCLHTDGAEQILSRRWREGEKG